MPLWALRLGSCAVARVTEPEPGRAGEHSRSCVYTCAPPPPKGWGVSAFVRVQSWRLPCLAARAGGFPFPGLAPISVGWAGGACAECWGGGTHAGPCSCNSLVLGGGCSGLGGPGAWCEAPGQWNALFLGIVTPPALCGQSAPAVPLAWGGRGCTGEWGCRLCPEPLRALLARPPQSLPSPFWAAPGQENGFLQQPALWEGRAGNVLSGREMAARSPAAGPWPWAARGAVSAASTWLQPPLPPAGPSPPHPCRGCPGWFEHRLPAARGW